MKHEPVSALSPLSTAQSPHQSVWLTTATLSSCSYPSRGHPGVKISVHAFICLTKTWRIIWKHIRLPSSACAQIKSLNNCFVVSPSLIIISLGPYLGIPCFFFLLSCYCMSRKPFPFWTCILVTSQLLANRLWCLHVHICSSAGSSAGGRFCI